MSGFNVMQSGFKAGGAARPLGDRSHFIGSQAIHRRTEQSMVRETEAHTPLLASPPDWTKVAKPCDWMEWGKDWDLDLSGGETKANSAGADLAADMCHGCPVLEQCLAAALEEEGTLGARNRYLIRGGKTPAQRAAIALGEPRPVGRPPRIIGPSETCGVDHPDECRWFRHPNGSLRCRGAQSGYERKRRASKKEAA